MAKSAVKDIKALDEATVEIMRGLNSLLLKAHQQGLTTITSILLDARDSIAWWAAHDNYHEFQTRKLLRQLGFHEEELLKIIEKTQSLPSPPKTEN